MLWDAGGKHVLGLSKSYYGMIRGRTKGREREVTRWIKEETVWKNREKSG